MIITQVLATLEDGAVRVELDYDEKTQLVTEVRLVSKGPTEYHLFLSKPSAKVQVNGKVSKDSPAVNPDAALDLRRLGTDVYNFTIQVLRPAPDAVQLDKLVTDVAAAADLGPVAPKADVPADPAPALLMPAALEIP